jgi:hypothetical protein
MPIYLYLYPISRVVDRDGFEFCSQKNDRQPDLGLASVLFAEIVSAVDLTIQPVTSVTLASARSTIESIRHQDKDNYPVLTRRDV